MTEALKLAEAAGWRTEAAAWLRRKADQQEATNEAYPKHVKCYPSWEKRVRDLRWLADDLDAEDAASPFGLDRADPCFATTPTQSAAVVTPEAWTEQQIADACVEAGISDSKFEGLMIALHAIAPADAQSAAAVPADNWQQYATERETTAQQVIERHRGEQDALLTLLADARRSAPAPADAGEPAELVGVSRESWIASAERVYRACGDDEKTAQECARWIADQQDWLGDEVDDAYVTALDDIEGRPADQPAREQAEPVAWDVFEHRIYGAPGETAHRVLWVESYMRPDGTAPDLEYLLDAARNGGIGRGAKTIKVRPLYAAAQPAREPLTDEQIEKGRKDTFSTDNPFCPCDSKTMRKAVRWAERAHGIGSKEQAK